MGLFSDKDKELIVNKIHEAIEIEKQYIERRLRDLTKDLERGIKYDDDRIDDWCASTNRKDKLMIDRGKVPSAKKMHKALLSLTPDVEYLPADNNPYEEATGAVNNYKIRLVHSGGAYEYIEIVATRLNRGDLIREAIDNFKS